MPRQVLVTNQTHPLARPIVAGYCSDFFSRLRGLMFQPGVTPHTGIILVQEHENRLDSAIHMFFCNFELATIWINNQLKVVDTRLARRWRPLYIPSGPARYVLETHPDHLTDFAIGDQLLFNNVALD
jgi:uncharacterized membrane protein (UPF0127 family)